ncbi:hypothetical protein WJT74_09770 [Sphingomicrobium sp. XHP0239]|uniref:hypothetical protein n=1 Tax=Sphingomicrobium maritimum TaxID=3133972 RepID=UPI0031CC6F4E
MRAVLAIGILIIVVIVAAATLNLFGPSEVETVVDRQVDLDDVGGKGPGFDVETGSVTPGEDEARATAEEADGPPTDTSIRSANQDDGTSQQEETATVSDDGSAGNDDAVSGPARPRGPARPAQP